MCAAHFYPAPGAEPPCGKMLKLEAEEQLDRKPLRHFNGSGATQSAQSKLADRTERPAPSSLSMLSDATLAGFKWEYGQPIPGETRV